MNVDGSIDWKYVKNVAAGARKYDTSCCFLDKKNEFYRRVRETCVPWEQGHQTVVVRRTHILTDAVAEFKRIGELRRSCYGYGRQK